MIVARRQQCNRAPQEVSRNHCRIRLYPTGQQRTAECQTDKGPVEGPGRACGKRTAVQQSRWRYLQTLVMHAGLLVNGASGSPEQGLAAVGAR